MPEGRWTRALAIVEKLSEEVLASAEVAHALVEFWRKAPATALPQDRYLSLWDRLWSAFARQATEDWEAKDAVGHAINDPAGKLAENLISRLWPRDARAGGGLPVALTDRIERIVARTNHQRPDASSIIVASRLEIIHTVSPDFAEGTVLPLLKWEKNSSASAYWHAFLWLARISPDLYKKLESDFFIALTHPEWFGESPYRTVCQMFLLASMEFKAVKGEDTAKIIGVLSPQGLRNLSSFIRQRVLNAKGDSDAYWANTVQPWLSAYWPRDHNKRSEGLAEDFAMTVLYCGEGFAQALRWFEENQLLVPTPTCTTILLALRSDSERTHEDFASSSLLPERFPADVLQLLWITRPFQWDHGYAAAILGRIIAAQPSLAHSLQYQELREQLG